MVTVVGLYLTILLVIFACEYQSGSFIDFIWSVSLMKLRNEAFIRDKIRINPAKHNLKFRHIGYNVDPHGLSFFPKCISAWNGLAQEIAEANTLDLFKSQFRNDQDVKNITVRTSSLKLICHAQ